MNDKETQKILFSEDYFNQFLQIVPAKIYGVGPVTVEKQLFKDGMRRGKGK